MAFKSILKPEGSVGMGLATAALVAGIYAISLPNTATTHATDANDPNIDAARKKATITSAAVLGGVTLITKDINVFILGGAILAALDFHARLANSANPDTGALVADTGYGTQLRSVS